MAIKVGGTDVINNSWEYINLTDISGNYNYVQASDATITLSGATNYNLSASNPVRFITLAGTWSCQYINNATAGVQMTVLVDTTSALHDINFTDVTNTSEWVFENDTEPTWTDARYWQITITCWDSIKHSVAAVSWGS